MKSLASQALQRVGKNWSTGSGTRQAKLQTVTRFAEFIGSRYGLERIENLKPAHIQAYAAHLHESGISGRTGANYMAFVRDLCAGIGKASICARDNAAYGFAVASRMNPLHQDEGKVAEIRAQLEAKAASGDRISAMMTATAAMRAEFGLRQKEALMSYRVVMVDGKAHLAVEGAKGGLPRTVEIRTAGQIAALDLQAKVAAGLGNGNGRPIPPEINLKAAMRLESKAWHKMGGTRSAQANMHAARHAYVQRRLAEGATRAQVNKEVGHGEQRSLGSYA